MAAQQWRHGWIPLTPTAAREKNHGTTPGPGSKLGKSLARSRETSQAMDTEIRRAARSRNKTVQPDRPEPADDVAEATKAIKSGDHARAVNLLTRAMNNAKGADKKAIKAKRDELARRLMGR
ncbi:hypothetical protein [Nonomuraea basaltis]|uniref:hypothetical protein n=1 Tax=Nonomuraea basaltis TaxID=2495887 RepID=UPI00110C657C|nr:hypothetical protein [Nonomuraea basaltis]TMS00173.1 hypothetical protein EJK15_03620 [Nonomuraea basaltis]